MDITHGSFFSGIGCGDLGAERAGLKNIFNCDINPFCRKVLKKNFPHVKQYKDITLIDKVEYVDIMSGGFPCQDISNAKSWTSNESFRVNGINGKRSGLWFEYLRHIETARPKFVVAENVASINKKGLDIVLQSLSDIGYFSEWATISAFRFGAPHLRKRTWIVAYPDSIGRQQKSIILSKVLGEKVRQAPQWEFSRTICKKNGKKNLSSSFGIHDGIARRMDDAERMTALGNAFIPQIAQAIFETIIEFENERNNKQNI